MKSKHNAEPTQLKKVWNFIWHDNSFESWLVNLALAVLLVKFIVYPLLGVFLGTQFPVVAVVSGSMEHHGTFEQWWSDVRCPGAYSGTSQADWYRSRNISEIQFHEFPFVDGFDKGDVMVLAKASDVKVGDILVFEAEGYGYPIIHRVVSVEEKIFKTKGDFNCAQTPFEQEIPESNVLGKGIARIPYLGWIKVWFVQALQFIASIVRG